MADEADRAVIARLTNEVVPALIERLSNSELGELEVREDGWRVRLRRPSAMNGEAPAGAAAARPQQGKQVPVMSHPATDAHAHAPRREPERGVITSPGVGYYTPRDGVSAGSTVRQGDLVGHVDVLGVRQEVLAPFDGTLAVLEVEAGQAVEYGQPIGRVAPESAPERAVVDV
jgi:acetyl-CoA carboxylase biotin carboxyl carrier protein